MFPATVRHFHNSVAFLFMGLDEERHFCVTNLSFKYKSEIRIKSTVAFLSLSPFTTLLYLQIQTALSWQPFGIRHTFIALFPHSDG
jgi:hypothetical protein